MPLVRLDRIIADTGMYSRSEAASLIKLGLVSVDGQSARSGSAKHDPDESNIAVNGISLDCRRYHYIMLNKPCGYVSSTRDVRNRTVMELLDGRYAKLALFPAGRLDKDAEGLLLLTDDGDLAHCVISPAKKIDKRYFVQFDGSISTNDVAAFQLGLTLSDGTACLPAILEPVDGGAFITVREGKYHQVKRMMAAVGKHVLYLKRVAIGALVLDDALAPGEYRELDDAARLIFGDSA